ncbi:hypothetical protein QZH41_018858, partial [Actinostola sp. cb2023]
PPTELIASVESKLSGFEGPLAIRVKTRVRGLKAKWASLTNDDQTRVTNTMGSLDSNLQTFGNAGSNPVGAVVGAVNIVGGFCCRLGSIGAVAFQHSKAYLDGAALSGEPLSEMEAILASTRVPMTLGLEFMGELAT